MIRLGLERWAPAARAGVVAVLCLQLAAGAVGAQEPAPDAAGAATDETAAVAEEQAQAPAEGPGKDAPPGLAEPVAPPSEDRPAVILEDVLASADVHFPLLVAAELERDVRAQGLRSSRGGFDTQLRMEGEIQPLAFYENGSGAIELEQPTTLWGARFMGGYRYGGGDFPSYDGDVLTDGSGEISAGLELPLLRGGPIDGARARIRRSKIDLARVEPEIALQRLGVRRDAAHAYWTWVASGLMLDVAERLLGIASARQTQIEGRVRRGAEAEIDLVDNERLILDRQLRLRAAERDFEQATASLSLYLRDPTGRPVLVGRKLLPAMFPREAELDPEIIAADLVRALDLHPNVRRLELDLDRIDVDQQLARNDALPRVDVGLVASQDFGDPEPGIDTVGSESPEPRSDTEVKALLRIELPIQQREARGRLAAARIRISQTERRLTLARERIEVEVRRSIAAIEAAHDQTVMARRNLDLAERLRKGEERKLSLGLSDLIAVNIRELQAASAALLLIEAQSEYFLALADYEAAAARFVVDSESGDGPV